MAAVSGSNGMTDSQLFGQLDAPLSGSNDMTDSQLLSQLDALSSVGGCFMTGSVEDLSQVPTDQKDPDISAELELFSARISEIRNQVLALKRECERPDSDKTAMRGQLGQYVQSLRRLQSRIIFVIGRVNSSLNQYALEDASRRIGELFGSCLDCLHVIEPPQPVSPWRLYAFVHSLLVSRPNPVEVLRKAFPVAV